VACATDARRDSDYLPIVRLFGSVFEVWFANCGADPASPDCREGVTVAARGSIGSNEAESSSSFSHIRRPGSLDAERAWASAALRRRAGIL